MTDFTPPEGIECTVGRPMEREDCRFWPGPVARIMAAFYCPAIDTLATPAVCRDCDLYSKEATDADA